MTDLGKLERVKLRDIWENEAQHFTPWLAQDDNLAILGDTIKIDLELEAQEKNVGPFSADILCKDTATGNWVLVENQLERTDHTHLGQLLTYAAGLQAVTIVWISAHFTEEHRAVLDWLNNITDDRFSFFGLEVELWRISGSPPAPKFNIISKPNDWTRSIGGATRRLAEGEVSQIKAQQYRYWEQLIDHLARENISALGSRKPRPQHWQNFSIGRTGFRLATKVNSSSNRISVEIFIYAVEAKPYFQLLLDDKEAIEQLFGQKLTWEELSDRKGSRIAVYKDNTDFTDETDWPNQHGWMGEMLIRFNDTFRDRLRVLDASELSPEGEEMEDEVGESR